MFHTMAKATKETPLWQV